jgi:hypothetical protein
MFFGPESLDLELFARPYSNGGAVPLFEHLILFDEKNAVVRAEEKAFFRQSVIQIWRGWNPIFEVRKQPTFKGWTFSSFWPSSRMEKAHHDAVDVQKWVEPPSDQPLTAIG